jgi:penicillin amidase
MQRTLPNILAAATLNDNDWFGDTRSWDDIIPLAWQRTIAVLRKRLGTNLNAWRYGAWHTIAFTHALGSVPIIGNLFNRGVFELAGNRDTVNLGDINTMPSGTNSYSCPSVRLICDTSDWERSKSIHPIGQSGHPLSQHYSDFIKPWLNVEYHPMPWNRRRVEEVSQDTLILTP